ncbi:MAG TPA: DUF3515 domain-containing protein [Candidatus Stackebrandtia excrementipullorum]|nr:DUF3515 domain-containing protein [Candidatus Stackebrandtia excrementipullorum]
MAEDKTKRKVDSSAGSDRRHAARIATLIAVPVTVVAVFVAFNLVSSVAEDHTPDRMSAPTDPVPVDVPALAEEDFEICRALISVVPGDLGDLPQRGVTGEGGAAEVSAAWGDPAVTLLCGGEPVEVADTDRVYRLDATCWLAVEGEDVTVWTTVDRTHPVELTVPAEHEPSGQLASALSEFVDEKIPTADEDSIPTGCFQ